MGYILIKTLSLKIIIALKLTLKKIVEFKNNNPIRYYIIDLDHSSITTGQVTSEDLKDIAAYKSSSLTTYLYDSTGKEKYVGNFSINNGFIIFDLGE